MHGAVMSSRLPRIRLRERSFHSDLSAENMLHHQPYKSSDREDGRIDSSVLRRSRYGLFTGDSSSMLSDAARLFPRRVSGVFPLPKLTALGVFASEEPARNPFIFSLTFKLICSAAD